MTNTGRLVAVASTWLTKALSSIDGDIVLASPYLSFETCERLSRVARGSGQRWTLVTALDASAVANGYQSVKGMRLLRDNDVELRHVARLHAKCFLVGDRGMLGSANLTGAGLGSSAAPNRELGVELTPEQVREAKVEVLSWPFRSVSARDLDQLLQEAKALTLQPKRSQPMEPDSNPADALRLAEMLLQDARTPGRSLWLKLEYGVPGLDSWRQESWFASPKKGKPKFSPGDLVVICARETRDCYAVVEVANEPEWQPEDYKEWAEANDPSGVGRWPWVTRTVPRLVPLDLIELKRHELGVPAAGLQNGHVRLQLDQFAAAVRGMARLRSDSD